MYKLPAIPYMPKLKMVVERYDFKPDWTIGKLYVNGVFVCYTMEDEMRAKKVQGETAVPFGVYPLGLRYSPKFSPVYKTDMIHIMNVPGFQYILFHPGNTDDDTDGCLLPGNELGTLKGQAAVLNSKETWLPIHQFIYNHLKSGGEGTIEYKKAV